MSSPDVCYKVIIIGDSGVGKTSLAIRQCKGSFNCQNVPTIGTSHLTTTICIDDTNVDLKLWDTAGQEQFASLVKNYIRGASVCIIVASLTDSNSVDHIELWEQKIRDTGENPPIIIAINKCDFSDGSLITVEEIKFKLSKYEHLIFASAKTGNGVEEIFALAAAAAVKFEKGQIENPEVIKETAKNKKCCD